MENRNYGRLVEEYSENQRFEYAPRSFRENGAIIVPRIDDDIAYFSRGWLKVIDVRPEIDRDTQSLKLVGYDQNKRKKTITFLYEIDNGYDNKPTRKIYNKLKLTAFCMDHGVWNDIKAKLQETGYYDLFVMAQRFASDDDFFNRGIGVFRKYLEGKVEDVDKFIASALAYAFDGEEAIAS